MSALKIIALLGLLTLAFVPTVIANPSEEIVAVDDEGAEENDETIEDSEDDTEDDTEED